jgi:hypothetical protein
MGIRSVIEVESPVTSWKRSPLAIDDVKPRIDRTRDAWSPDLPAVAEFQPFFDRTDAWFDDPVRS